MKTWMWGLLAFFVIGGGVYYIALTYTAPKTPVVMPQITVQTAPDVQYKGVTNATLGVSFEVPQDWILEDHLSGDTGALWVIDPRSLGDGVDGYSFTFQVSRSSKHFSALLSPETGDHFAHIQALPNNNRITVPGKKYNGTVLPGEDFVKVANLTIAGYPTVHFHTIDAASSEWGARDIQDGYWVRVGENNLFFYFTNISTAKKYTYENETPIMQHILGSIKI